MTEKQWMTTYRETIHPLFRFIAKRTGGNRELTEDIVQESYLRALNSWKRKDIPDSSLAWLQRVARNILVDYLRQRKRVSNIELDIDPDTVNGKSKDLFESLETFLTISSLGRKKAEFLEAFYYEGMSVKEIAHNTNTSEKAVEGQLRRARQSLKSLLPQLKLNGERNE